MAGVTLLYFAVLIVLAEPLTGCRRRPMLRGLVGPGISSLVAAGACFAILSRLRLVSLRRSESLFAGLDVFTASMFLVDRKGLTEDWDVVRRLMKARGGG